jgi:hypothetical protein
MEKNDCSVNDSYCTRVRDRELCDTKTIFCFLLTNSMGKLYKGYNYSSKAYYMQLYLSQRHYVITFQNYSQYLILSHYYNTSLIEKNESTETLKSKWYDEACKFSIEEMNKAREK